MIENRVRGRAHYTRRLGRILAAGAVLALAGCGVPRHEPPVEAPPAKPAPPPTVRFEPVPWSAVQGWQRDAVQEAWPALVATCRVWAGKTEWQRTCAEVQSMDAQRLDAATARALLERTLDAYRVVQEEVNGPRTDSGLVTGYYEPVLRGARRRDARFRVPLYAPPDDLLTVELGELYPELKGQRVRGRVEGRKVLPYYSRAELDPAKLAGKELVWVEDPVDAFFLQVQGSGRIELPRGETIRLAYADQNGHPYRSIGRYLVDRGELTLDEVSAPKLREWLRRRPERQQEVLNANPSYVFFREEKLPDPAVGPKGGFGVPLTPGRSIAVDPRHIPLGAPVFLATTQPNASAPLERLVVAQDTGGAIRGILRADLFFGWGPQAGDAAGRMRQPGRMWLLWPKGSEPRAPE